MAIISWGYFLHSDVYVIQEKVCVSEAKFIVQFAGWLELTWLCFWEVVPPELQWEQDSVTGVGGVP